MANTVKNPLDDYQLLQEVSGGSYFFANTDDFGVETTKTLEGTAKPYITNEDGENALKTGEPLNAVPRGDLDKGTYDNTSDVYYNPEYTYEVPTNEESGTTNG